MHEQRDGRVFVGFAPRAGRVAGHQLRIVADLADAFGDGQLAATAQQKLVIRGVDPARADELVARLDDLDLRARPNAFRKGTMACTGIEFCKLAIGETKGRAMWLTEELAARLPGFDEEIRIHVNGCPNSCARFQVADIGLMSALQPRMDGTRSDAFLIHLGGGMGEGAALGSQGEGREDLRGGFGRLRRAAAHAVPAATRNTYVVRRVRERAGRRAARAVRGAGRRFAMSTPRAVPFYCPFCGEQDLRPDDPSGWRCLVCERRFELTVTGVGEPT